MEQPLFESNTIENEPEVKTFEGKTFKDYKGEARDAKKAKNTAAVSKAVIGMVNTAVEEHEIAVAYDFIDLPGTHLEELVQNKQREIRAHKQKPAA